MKTSEVRVVRVPNRRLRVVVGTVLVVVVLAMLFAAYHLGLGLRSSDARDTVRLNVLVDELTEENRGLRQALVDAQVASRVDREAANELKTTLAAMHDHQAELREEVTFYRSLMAPSSVERGLQISEFALVPLEDAERTFRYELLLTQVEARRSVVQGSVGVDVVGENRGDQVVLSLTEMEPQTDYPLKYRFRYFQDFSGSVTLPEGFEPLRVVVTVTPRGNRGENLQRTFDWHDSIGK